MATQVVMFSVLLFGTSGVVLDFGRVYNEHSRMQAFTDQAALAAAYELDGAANAIQNAANRVFGSDSFAPIVKTSKFANDDGALYGISHLYFLSEMKPETGAQFDISADLENPNGANSAFLAAAFANGSIVVQSQAPYDGDLAAASADARYVIAIAEERKVSNTLMRLINSAGGDAVPDTNPVRTIAAAKRRNFDCGPRSNLVVCNPFEGHSGLNFVDMLGDPTYEGLQFKFNADGQIDADGNMSLPNSLGRRIDDELMGIREVEEICNSLSTVPGGLSTGAGSDDSATTRAICMLAAAREKYQCEEGTVEYTAAEAEVVATSLGTAFDLWDYPISEVLTWDQDASGRHSQEPGWGGPSHSQRNDSVWFQPDLHIMKHMMWSHAKSVVNATLLGTPASSRLNYDKPGTIGDGYYDSADYLTTIELRGCFSQITLGKGCFQLPAGGELDYVSLPANPNFYTRAGVIYGSAYPDLEQHPDHNFNLEVVASRNENRSIHSMYNLYRHAREAWIVSDSADTTVPDPGNGVVFDIKYGQSQAVPYENSYASPLTFATETDAAVRQEMRTRVQTAVREDASLDIYVYDQTTGLPATTSLDGDPVGFDREIQLRRATDPTTGVVLNPLGGAASDFVPAYSNYTFRADDPVTGATQIDRAHERRKINVTFVNCGLKSVNDDGNIEAPVIGYGEMFLIIPPQVNCFGGGSNCLNSASGNSTDIYLELIRKSASDPKNFAELVR